jgi:hypothetical protein
MFGGILGVEEGLQTSDATNWSLTYPDLIQPGELLAVLAACDGNLGSNPTISGWVTSRANAASNTATQLFAKKKATGTESGSFTMTLDTAEQGCWKVVRIGPWEATLGANFTNSDSNGGAFPFTDQLNGTGTSIATFASDPFNWDVDDTLWIFHNIADGGDTVFDGPPTGYSLIGTLQNSGGADGAAQMACYRKRRVAQETPGTITLSPSEEWASSVFPLRPLTGGGPKRLFGPTPVPSAPATVYVVPDGARALVRNIHAYNPGSGPVDLTISIGPDGAGTRILDAYPVPEDVLLPRRWFQYALNETEVIQVSASIDNQLVLTIDGDQVPYGD